MASGQSNPSKPKRRRRWLQFSLRTMLLVTLLVALVLGWLAEKIDVAWRQQRAAESILKLGGQVHYGYQFFSAPGTLSSGPPPRPPGPKWLRWLMGEHFFARVAVVTYPPGISDKDLKHLDDLPYLTQIHLRGGTVTGAGLNHVWKHDKLRALTLRSVSVTDVDAANLAGLTQLEQLDLRHTPITDETVKTLSGLPKLSRLLLEGTFISHEAARRLEKSFLSYGEETWAPAPSEEQRQIAAALEQDGALVDVRRKIYGTEPEYSVTFYQAPMNDRKLGLLERLEALKTLVFLRTSIEEAHWARIAGCDTWASDEAEATDVQSTGAEGLPQLKTLTVRNAPLTDKQMRHIGTLVDLETLYLYDTQVTDAGLGHLASLEKLKELGLRGPGFSDAGLIHLASLPSLSKLELFGSQFTDDGLKHVGALSQIEELWLCEATAITDAGLAHLAGLGNLTWLAIHSPNVTDAGLAHVAKLTSLTRLSLHGAQISQAGLEHVRKLPRLEACWVNATNVMESTDELPMLPVLE
jgi:Leucine-rich repeat (LRR) protein